MTLKRIFFASMLCTLWFVACNNSNKTASEFPTKDTLTQSKEMKSYLSMFEIPARDIARAIRFYEVLLNIQIEKMEVDGMQMGIFPYEGQVVTGVIIQSEGYKPSSDGVTMYLNAGDNLQLVLDRVEKNGGKLVVPKTAHADGSGYFAIFVDSEGNKVGLHSPN